MKKYLPVIVLSCFAFSAIRSQDDPQQKGVSAIPEQCVKAQLEFLSSDWMEGRETGEKGIDLAADYIASMFGLFGLQPAGNLGSPQGNIDVYDRKSVNGSSPDYFQDFALVKAEQSSDQELAVITEQAGSKKITRFCYENDFDFITPPKISQEGEFPVVFAGYGIVNKNLNYDDYKGIDVKGKVVLRLVGYPGHRDTLSEAYRKFHPAGNAWTKYREDLDRNNIAIEKGAVAVITVYTVTDKTLDFAGNIFRYNTSTYEGDVAPRNTYSTSMYFPGDTVSGNIPVYSVAIRIANELTAGTKFSIEAFEKQVTLTMKPDSKELGGRKVYLRETVNTKVVRARNVLGMIEGENPDEMVVIGAHYDHLGKYNGYVYNGSDDNASGTVAVMTIAKAFMAAGIKPRRTVVFAAWTAEEKGLLGSQYFVDHLPAAKMITYLNFDMISRDGSGDTLGNQCSMTYTQAKGVLEEISKKCNDAFDLGLQIKYKPREKPGGGSDHNAFAKKDIPIYYYMAGWHDDYHKPSDHSNKADIPKMTNIIKLGFLTMWEIANGKY
jgi:hypothetical protein